VDCGLGGMEEGWVWGGSGLDEMHEAQEIVLKESVCVYAGVV
jgi:hypothetical protein